MFIPYGSTKYFYLSSQVQIIKPERLNRVQIIRVPAASLSEDSVQTDKKAGISDAAGETNRRGTDGLPSGLYKVQIIRTEFRSKTLFRRSGSDSGSDKNTNVETKRDFS
jgi:hypothetical protein